MAATDPDGVPHVRMSGSDLEKKPAFEEINIFSLAEDKAMRRRIDWRLIPALGLMYGVSLMDRTNLPNAAIAGMRVNLNFHTGQGYNIVTLVFFITYTLLQPPMVILCRKIGPRVFLPTICLAWGLIVVGFGLVNRWQDMIGLRLVLGLLEAGFFPGCVYVLSTWYTRYEVGRRYSAFYGIGGLLSALSGPLAYGLSQMGGLAGKSGWRWIFLMEGIITIFIAIVAGLFIVRFPDQERVNPSYKFLRADECEHIITKIEADRADAQADSFDWRKYLGAGKSIEVWGFGLIFFCTTTIAYAFSFFLPIILQESLGRSVLEAQCLGAPPYILAMVFMSISSWAGDKYHIRAPIIIVNAFMALIGLPILGFASNPWVRYFGVFIALAGTQANVPNIMAYQANNIRGQWTRAFCSATLTGLGGVGGIAGSLIFRTQDRPGYVPGMIGCIVASAVVIITCILLSILFRLRNKRAERGDLVINGLEGFRYTI